MSVSFSWPWRSSLPLPLCSNEYRNDTGRDPSLAPFEQGEIGPDLFRHACLMGLEGLVSKLKDRPYRPGRSPHWVKVKNRQHPAFSRVIEAFG